MNDDSLDRRNLTFAQAEGHEALPQPLELGEVSQQLRALLWAHFWSMFKTSAADQYGGVRSEIQHPWSRILLERYLYVEHGMLDEFDYSFPHHHKKMARIFKDGDYIEIFDFVQYVLRHRDCPRNLSKMVAFALKESLAPYGVVDGSTIMPIASAEERVAIERAFADLSTQELHGARAHLQKAGELINHSHFADSVRESIHAVEAVARTIEPNTLTLGRALKRLEKSTVIHGQLKDGFEKIYGYTCDEQGIRHALLNKPKAEVEQHDAVFMLGACASFITYLLGKAVDAGIPLTKRATEPDPT
jgi:hypothetical protein